jgi:hypothetical protein
MLTFLRKLRRDPAADWPAVRVDHLVIDTTAQTVNGIKLPCEHAQLATIGRPGNRHSLLDRFVKYPELGAIFDLHLDGRVRDVGVCLIDMGGDGPPARRCVIVGRGGRAELVPGTKIDVITSAVGQGASDADEEEVVWTYHLGAFDLTVECALDGTVRYLNYFLV